jgi:hypothetical protein
MYAWFNKHLGLNLPADKLAERDFQRLSRDEMSVWDGAHPAPSGDQAGPAFEKKLTRWLADDAEKQMAAHPELAQTGWKHLIGRTLETAGDKITFDIDAAQKTETDEFVEIAGPVVNETYGEEVQTAFFYPKNWKGEVFILLGEESIPPNLKAEALKDGRAIVCSKLFRPGEKNQPVAGKREAPCYTYGYNRPLLAQRVDDVLTLLKFVRTRENYDVKKVEVSGSGIYSPIEMIVWSLTAQDPAGIKRGSSPKVNPPETVTSDYLDPNFLPGYARYGRHIVSLSQPPATNGK